MSATAAPVLAADLTDGLKTAQAGRDASTGPAAVGHREDQRWTSEEFLRTLVEAEIAARDASNARNRMRAAAFPVTKTLLTARTVRTRPASSARREVRVAEVSFRLPTHVSGFVAVI